MLNLLTNAIKFTTKGSITIFMDYEKIKNNKTKINCSIKDTGVGIKEKDKKRIFELFTKIHNDDNRYTNTTPFYVNIYY